MSEKRNPNPPAGKTTERKDHEPPAATSRMGWRYHHMGIPTRIRRPGERHIPHLKLFVSGFEESPYGIEWMRFEKGCPIQELVQSIPHIAFEVDNLESALAGKEIISEIISPSEGTRVAYIRDNGTPVELIEFRRR